MNIKNLGSNSRIVIVGTSGAGKSTLARKLSEKLNLNDIELDALFWEPNWQHANQEEFRNRISRSIENSKGWVVHGNYSKVRDLTWSKASTLIWLDYSRTVVFWRVLIRSFLRIIKREKLWSGNREFIRKTFFSSDSIIWWSIKTYPLRKQQYEALTRSSEYSHLNILRFKRPKEAELFIQSI